MLTYINEQVSGRIIIEKNVWKFYKFLFNILKKYLIFAGLK
jgi:hypothetical protein